MLLAIASAGVLMATATVMLTTFTMLMSAMPMPTVHEKMHQWTGQ
jgi:hypothetical protein